MSNKRARFDQDEGIGERMNKLTLHKNNTLPSDTSWLTVLTIVDNKKIKRISNIKNLTVLRCYNTELTFIGECASLFYLSINNDVSLLDLTLNDLYKVKLSNCNISKLCIRRTDKVQLTGLSNLSFIRLIDVNKLALNNINIMCLEQLKFFAPEIKELVIENCDITYISEFLKNSSVSLLKIKNCTNGKEILNLKTKGNMHSLSIKNCKDINIISNIANVKTIKISNCTYLRRISTIKNVCELIITDCDKLRSIDELENIDALSIKRCISIVRLNNSISAKKIESINNISVKSICINDTLSSLYIVNNTNLEDLEYDNLYSENNLNLSIIGDTCFRSIESWSAKSLYIKDNNFLDFIGYVQGIYSLKLENVPNLETIEDFYIHHKLWISDCDNLINISNIYGFENLKLVNCVSLQHVNIGFGKVKRMELRHLPMAKIHMRASSLVNLYINSVEFVTMYDHNPNIIVNATNTAFLHKGISYMEKCFVAAQKITNYVQTYKQKKRYNTFKVVCNNNDLCSICFVNFTKHEYENCMVTYCNHVYHKKCMNEWVKRRAVCPLCLSNQSHLHRQPAIEFRTEVITLVPNPWLL